VGGLKNALNFEFHKINSPLTVLDDEALSKLPVTYARVEKEKKFSQIYLAADEKLYLPDFWRDGVCLAHGQADNLTELAKALDFWLCEDVTTKKLSEVFRFILPNDKAMAFDEGREIEYAWEAIHMDSSRIDLQAFVTLAIKDEILNKLFPFTSLNRLCFSRCTGYPYTSDTPIVIPVGDQKYEVRAPDNYSLGSGTAVEALRIIREQLPLNIKPAIKGTAEDIQ
jgi:hypothetical protein